MALNGNSMGTLGGFGGNAGFPRKSSFGAIWGFKKQASTYCTLRFENAAIGTQKRFKCGGVSPYSEAFVCYLGGLSPSRHTTSKPVLETMGLLEFLTPGI